MELLNPEQIKKIASENYISVLIELPKEGSKVLCIVPEDNSTILCTYNNGFFERTQVFKFKSILTRYKVFYWKPYYNSN